MTRNRKYILTAILFLTALLFLLASCAYLSNLPLIGKKKEKVDQLPEGKTVTIEGMETVKGVNPSKTEPSS